MSRYIKIIIFSAIGIVILAFIIKISPLNKILKPSSPLIQLMPGISPDILFLTPEIKSFTGNIEKVDKDSITVSREIKIENLPNTPARKLTYKVIIAPNTKINRFFSTSDDKNLKAGDQITVLTNSDLRVLQNKEFQAITINVIPKITSLSGTITAINGNTLTVKGTAIIPPVPELFANGPPAEKNYDVNLTKETEISRQAKKLTSADLKKGMFVAVYSDSALSSAPQVQAKKIEAGGILPPTIPNTKP